MFFKCTIVCFVFLTCLISKSSAMLVAEDRMVGLRIHTKELALKMKEYSANATFRVTDSKETIQYELKQLKESAEFYEKKSDGVVFQFTKACLQKVLVDIKLFDMKQVDACNIETHYDYETTERMMNLERSIANVKDHCKKYFGEAHETCMLPMIDALHAELFNLEQIVDVLGRSLVAKTTECLRVPYQKLETLKHQHDAC